MKKQKMFFTVLVLLIAVSIILTGCGNKTGASGPTTAGTKSPITFSFFNADGSPTEAIWNDAVSAEITRRTGVSLQVDYPVGGDYVQAIGIMIASGDLPDFIFAKGDLTMLIDAGMILPLDDLIDKRGANLKRMYGSMLGRLRNSLDDPNIYSVGTYGLVDAIWSTDGTMQLQHAVLKELGYPKMQTLADYEQAIRTYKTRYPTINGRPTIAFSLLIDTWQWYIDLSNPSCFLLGYPDDGQWLVDQNTLEAYYKFYHPQASEYYKWLNKIYHEGLLDPESFTQTEDEWRAKIAQGRVLGIAYPGWGYGDARTSLISAGMPERTYAYLPIALNDSYKLVTTQDPGFSGGWGIAISTSCKDPERAMEFLDWWCTEEAQILVNWGIEGQNYNIINGQRVVPENERIASNTDPDYARRTGVGVYQHPFPQWGRGNKASNGQWITRDSPEYIKLNYLDVENETLAAYGADMWIDLFPPAESLGVPRHGQAWQYSLPTDLNAKLQEADDYIKTALCNIIIGSPQDFDAAWARIIQDLNRIGINDSAAMTEQVKNKVRLWESF